MKKILCIILSLTICIGLTATAFAVSGGDGSLEIETPNYELNTTANVSEVYLSNIGDSNAAFTNLFDSFRTNMMNMNGSGYSVSGVYASQFPEYYAGAYINTDGQLVVLLVDTLTWTELNAAKVDVCQRAGSEDIIFGTAANSYSALVNAMSQVSDYMENNTTTASMAEIRSARINDYQNAVVAGIATEVSTYGLDGSNTLNSIIEAQNDPLFNSSVIVFEEDNSELLANINCGDKLNGNGASFSAGFRAKYTNSSGSIVYGIVTCGHAFTGCTSAVSVIGGLEIIGTLDPTRNTVSGDLDAAFIKTSSSGAISNKVVDSNGTTYNISSTGIIGPAMGGIVYMRGYATGSVQQGVVSDISAIKTLKDSQGNIIATLSDIYGANYNSQPGDSGGIVFAYTSTNEYATAGVHIGSNDTGVFFTKALNIASEFGIWVY